MLTPTSTCRTTAPGPTCRRRVPRRRRGTGSSARLPRPSEGRSLEKTRRVGNINGSALRAGDLSAATTVSAYKGPSPPWGSHRYGQFLFEQPKRIDFEILPSPDGIYNWDHGAFVERYGLGAPVAVELPHDAAHGPAVDPKLKLYKPLGPPHGAPRPRARPGGRASSSAGR